MTECDCRSLAPSLILLLFIPIIILTSHLDDKTEPTQTTVPEKPVDYTTPVVNGLKFYKSLGMTGLVTTLLVFVGIGYKLYQYRKYALIAFLCLFGISIIMWFTVGFDYNEFMRIPIFQGNYTR